MKIAVCAREQGIDMVAAPLYDDLDVYYQEQFFGPWTIEQAEKFGFTPPMRDADLVANGVVPKDFVGHTQPALRAAGAHNASLEEKYSAQLDKCQEKAVDTYQAMRAIRGTPWNDQLGVLRESIVKEPKFVKALDDLGECLHEHGLKPAEKLPGFVEGFDEKHITEEQVTMAVQVVQCKNSVDFTQRVADLWAGLQAPILKKYDKEIAAQRKENAAAVSAARAFVASHPEVLVP